MSQLFPDFKKDHNLAFSLLTPQGAVIVSHPFDCIQNGVAQSKNPSRGVVPAIIDATKSIFEKQGLKGFFIGLPSRMMAVGGGSCISFTVYNQALKYYSENQ